MKKIFLLLLVFVLLIINSGNAQVPLDSILPVRGLCISLPSPDRLADFISFMKNELAPNHINTLILRVDYNYEYESYPNLRDSIALSKKQVKELVKAAKESSIKLIPQINLLGHQSWANHPEKLLEQYPQFDETPWVKFPEKYVWPNPDKLYCKSYCPLHPDVHKVLFALIDEIVNVFETDAFHAGMDEVFYLGEEQCPRCQGKDKSRLFADEVRMIHDHLATHGWKMWMWGDRFLDGSGTGLGEWEASMNDTWRAADLAPNDIMICDWHYEKAEPTPAYFALKGFPVVICPWNRPEVALAEMDQMVQFHKNSNPVLAGKMSGFVQTVWNDAGRFIDSYYGKVAVNGRKDKSADCLKAIFQEMKSLANKQ